MPNAVNSPSITNKKFYTMHPISIPLLSNPLATPSQLLSTPSQADGLPASLERSLLFAGSMLIQSSGIILRLPQTTIATAIVLFQRFWLVGSMREFSVKAVISSSLYLSSKQTEHPRPPRDIINVLFYLLNNPSPCPISPPKKKLESKEQSSSSSSSPSSLEFYVDEATYQHHKSLLLSHESYILKLCSFQTHVCLPYSLAINYLQVLDALPKGQAKRKPKLKKSQDENEAKENEDKEEGESIKLVKRVFGYLTDALISPSLLYLTHQPNALATAAIYLAARETGVKLPDPSIIPTPAAEQSEEGEGGREEEEEVHGWWEVFDVEREELGFLVVCLKATQDWVGKECEANKNIWGEWLGTGIEEEGDGTEGIEKELTKRRKENMELE